MPNIDSLLQRIDSEFVAIDQKLKAFQTEQLKSYEDRQRRLELFEKTCDQLREIWRPRLEALSRKFNERVKVTPNITRERREVVFDFESNLARIELKFTASTDDDVRNLVLDYRLEILPILMKFEPHKQAEFPLDSIDTEAITRWFDDRIVDFVRDYLSLHQNEYYLKDHMVVDPVAGIRFPRFAAASTLDWQGETYYFIADKTRQEFARKHQIA